MVNIFKIFLKKFKANMHETFFLLSKTIGLSQCLFPVKLDLTCQIYHIFRKLGLKLSEQVLTSLNQFQPV